MRFVVSYKVNVLDLTYRMKVYGLIKEAVRLANGRYYEQLFEQSGNKMKPYSFAVFLHNFSLQDTTIHLDKIKITISSPDIEFCVHCFNGLRKVKEYQVNDEVWLQSQIQLLNEHTITNRKVILRTISPILIEDKNGKPLSPTDANYETELNYYANLQVQQFANRDLHEQLRFTPIHMNKAVIKERNRHLKSDSYLYFTTYKGLFMLEGDPRDLQLLYQLGLGKRTAYFGLVDYEGEGM
ncbi:CRISPR-associated endoribonuclease Cas6 [Aneurinibacillus terranovensis]|uniref:CRISPR-associated endoribonuclease Cas6 n=1 Tax=Aneurinibacillus terranovensis TaxID=278991 RepID=UPI000411FAF3|nr:CRISPR-associated endoribonuclease Cas6 [Aneurinibacillus terranovensis]